MPRIQLLKESDIRLFDNPPLISEENYKTVFNLANLYEFGLSFRKHVNKVGFIIQRGYFLVANKFYVPQDYHDKHVNFVCHLCGVPKVDINEYNRSLYTKHRSIILEHMGYASFISFKKTFILEAKDLVKTSLRPREIFNSLISILNERKIEQPRYYFFADSISSALNEFETNLINEIDVYLSQDEKDNLDSLMQLPSSENREVSASNPYLITQLKKPIQAITPKKIKESLDEFEIIAELHSNYKHIFDSVGLLNELINYYAVWVIKAEHIQFDKISNPERKRLFLLAFITYQYRIRQDLFVDTYMQLIQKHDNATNNELYKLALQRKLPKRKQFAKIKNLVISAEQKITRIGEVLFSNEYQKEEKLDLLINIYNQDGNKYQELLLEEIRKIEEYNKSTFEDQFKKELFEKNYNKLQRRVGRILSILDFNENTSSEDIFEAVKYYKEKKGNIYGNVPISFISQSDIKWIYKEEDTINPQIYKTYLFRGVAEHIKAGTLNLRFSDKYKAIHEYLISEEIWDKDKVELIQRSNLHNISNFGSYMDSLKYRLKQQYERTNLNFEKNQYLKLNKEGKPIVSTPKIEKLSEVPIHELIGKERYYPLINIISDVNQATNFTSSFIHYSRKSTKASPDSESIFAAIIALGCNIGVSKMGKISNGITPNKIENVKEWYFSKQNIDEANKTVLDFINKLSLPKLFLNNYTELHTSSDGQKFNVSVPSVHATNSFKYFGSGKGVSAYSFIDEKNRLFYNTVISASEREASYVIDGLMFNEEVESNMHSTDTHGFSELVFAVCNSLGIFFAPRIKRYGKQIISTFKDSPRKEYEKFGYKILPAKSMYVNSELIEEQWDNILRLLCSIKLKNAKASSIFKRLSSYSKQHPLHKALKELGRVHKSIFLLKYLDESSLRQRIDKQLNKIEQSHQFSKAIFFGNNQEFKVGVKEEQEVAVACRHLIQNIIVLWNYLFLSQKLTAISTETDYDNFIKSLKNTSIMSWQHINLIGQYDFQNIVNNQYDLEQITSLKLS